MLTTANRIHSILSLQEKLADTSREEKKTYNTPPTMKEWFVPYPHQGRAVEDKLLANGGSLIIGHKMGLGKTVTSIYGVERLRQEGKANKTLVVVPSGLRQNFAIEGLEKFLKNPNYQVIASAGEVSQPNYVRQDNIDPNKEYTIVSYDMFRANPEGLMRATGADTLVFDEFHKTRNEQSGTFKAAMIARGMAKNFIGLTASLINNENKELATLLTISEGRRMLSPKDFANRYEEVVGYESGFRGGKKEIRGLKNVQELVENVDPRVDVADASMLEGGKVLPRKETSFVDVEMSPDQWKLYQLAMKELGPLNSFMLRRDAQVTVKDAESLFSRTAQARKISNSIHTGREMSLQESAKNTPKVKRMLDDTVQHLAEKPDNKVVLYSNLINGGVDVLSAGLTDRGIKHALFVGKGTEVGGDKITSKVRERGLEEYKKGDYRVIILSGAGAEGLSLNNSTAFFAMDGHFNPERIMQAEARVRRLGGQSHRPLEERVVDVRRYRSVAPKTASGVFSRMESLIQKNRAGTQTIDEWTYNTANRKYRQNYQLYEELKRPPKYTRRWRDNSGRWRYEYANDNVFSGIKKFVGLETQPVRKPLQAPLTIE